MAKNASPENGIAHVTKTSREQFRIQTTAMQNAAMRACRDYARVGDIDRGAAALAEWVDAGAAWDVYQGYFPDDSRLNRAH